MKIHKLIKLLQSFDPEWEVAMKTEEGFSLVDKGRPGVFIQTDYNNDFISYSLLIVDEHIEKRVVCLESNQPESLDKVQINTHEIQ